jgi:hypothetical protein
MIAVANARWSHHRPRTRLVVLVTSAALVAAAVAAPPVAAASPSGSQAWPTGTATGGATRAPVAAALQDPLDGGVVGASAAPDEAAPDHALSRREPDHERRPGDGPRVGSITKPFPATIALPRGPGAGGGEITPAAGKERAAAVLTPASTFTEHGSTR